MQLNASSLLLLKKLSAKNRAQKNSSVVVKHQDSLRESKAQSKSNKERFGDWLSPKPEAIQAFPGEKEIFRKGLVLVTDLRLAYIDPFDRMLKSYMFEHMISVHKQFYRTTVFNRRLCKGLLILSILVFVVTLTIDVIDSSANGFILVYIPLFASILLGIKVWNDMKPRYVIHWRMGDHTYDEISQEPYLSERLTGDNKREVFMNELANAINQALSARAWWPGRNHHKTQDDTDGASSSHNDQTTDSQATDADKIPTARLKLVTDNYQ